MNSFMKNRNAQKIQTANVQEYRKEFKVKHTL